MEFNKSREIALQYETGESGTLVSLKKEVGRPGCTIQLYIDRSVQEHRVVIQQGTSVSEWSISEMGKIMETFKGMMVVEDNFRKVRINQLIHQY